MKQHTWRAARATCVIAVVVMVAAVIAVAGLVLITVRGVGHPAVVITLGVLALLGIAYLWRFALYPRIVLDERLTVINPLSTHIMELDEPRGIEAGPNGLRITTDHGVVEAWCVQKGTGAIRAGRATRADAVADELTRELDRRVTATLTAGPSIPDAAVRESDGSDDTVVTDSTDSTDAPETSGSTDTARTDGGAGDEATSGIGAPAEATGSPSPSPSSADQPAMADPATVEAEQTDSVTASPADDDRAPVDPTTETGSPAPGGAAAAAPAAAAADARSDLADQHEGDDEDDEDDDDDDDDLIIRRAHRDELDVLVDLERAINTAALAPIFGSTPFPTEAVEDRWRESLGDRRIRIRIAEIDDRPIGFVSYDQGSIRQLGVLAAHTRQGHGTALLDYALDDLERNGCTAPTLRVLEANQSARAFYESLGWRDTGEREVSPFDPHPVEMTLVLDRSGR